MELYKCRLCELGFRNERDLIYLFSDEAKNLNLLSKIFFSENIMINSHESKLSRFICKVCSGHVEVNCNFKRISYLLHKKYLDRLFSDSKSDPQFLKGINKMMKLPYQFLFFLNVDYTEVYNSVLKYAFPSISDNLPKTKVDNDLMDLINLMNESNNSSNGFNKNAITNGISQSSGSIPTPSVSRQDICNSVSPIIGWPIVVNNTNNDHNYVTRDKTQPNNVKKPVVIDEVICLDDDDDVVDVDANATINTNTNGNNNVNLIKANDNYVNPKNIWIDHTKNIFVKAKQSKKKSQATRTLQFNRKLISIFNHNNPSQSTGRRVLNIPSNTETQSQSTSRRVLNIPSNTETQSQSTSRRVLNIPSNTETQSQSTSRLVLKVPSNTENTSQSTSRVLKIPSNTENPSKSTSRVFNISSNTETQSQSTSRRVLQIPSNTENPLNVSTEQMTVTPDMPTLTMSPLSNQTNTTMFYTIPTLTQNESTESLGVTPETGVHFLLTPPEPSIDLTTTDKTKRKKNDSLKMKIKIKKNNYKIIHPSKRICQNMQVALDDISEETNQSPSRSQSLRSLPTRSPLQSSTTKNTIRPPKQPLKLRPKRASSLTANSKITNSGLSKLGAQSNSAGWTVPLHPIQMSLYQCPICHKYFSSAMSRGTHEQNEHRSLALPSNSTVNTISTSENTTSTKQQEFLIYFNLGKRNSDKKNVINELANRTHSLQALKMYENTVDTYKCHYCEYTTTLMIILWIHMSACHLDLEVEKRSNPFCFICGKMLINKRSKLLKHIDKCSVEFKPKNKLTVSLVPKKFVCSVCFAEVDSYSLLEKHIWYHAKE